MTIWIFEENLLWSSRLRSGVQGLGHTTEVRETYVAECLAGDFAIVNLGSRAMPPEDLIPKLKASGVFVIAHAGHKEKPLQVIGLDSGADMVVTNSELTNKLSAILARAMECVDL